MIFQSRFALALIAGLSGLCLGQMRIGDKTFIVFASVDEGKKILAARDEYIRCQGSLERSIRMKTDKTIDEKSYLKFLGGCVLPWSENEKRKVESAFEMMREPLEKLSLPFPDQILLIKTNGREEDGAPHTRGNAVVFPATTLAENSYGIRDILCHEIFHVLTRANPNLRERLYKAIGFVPCKEVELPDLLKARRITNPDAPFNNHCIQIEVEDKPVWAVPVIFSDKDHYNPKLGGGMFTNLRFLLLLVERVPDSNSVRVLYEDDKPRMADVGQVSGLMEQVGMNTSYLIHPEEILASNFVLIVLPKKHIPSPDILKKISDILSHQKQSRLEKQHYSSPGPTLLAASGRTPKVISGKRDLF